MTLAAKPDLEPGRAYRTREFRRWGANPTRLAKRLVREGQLREAAHGLFYVPVEGRFGRAPVRDEELLRAFLDGSPFVITGPPKWNALNLGATAMFAATLVYNTERTGTFVLDGRPFLLRRVRFPEDPPPEWFVIDFLQQHHATGVARDEVVDRLADALREARWNAERLRAMAADYGTKETAALVDQCVDLAAAAT